MADRTDVYRDGKLVAVKDKWKDARGSTHVRTQQARNTWLGRQYGKSSEKVYKPSR